MSQSFEQEFLFENPFNSEWDSGHFANPANENPFNSEKEKWDSGHFANPANGRISGIWGRGDYPATDAGGFEQYFHRQQIDPIGPWRFGLSFF